VRRPLIVILPILVLGVVAAAITFAAHQANPEFTYAQQHPTQVDPRQLELILQRTREPVPGGNGSPAVAASCTAGETGPKLNPWSCKIRYRNGAKVSYQLVVALNGAFEGADRTGSRVIRGCCLVGGSVASE
jgi:hypothetical protein